MIRTLVSMSLGFVSDAILSDRLSLAISLAVVGAICPSAKFSREQSSAESPQEFMISKSHSQSNRLNPWEDGVVRLSGRQFAVVDCVTGTLRALAPSLQKPHFVASFTPLHKEQQS